MLSLGSLRFARNLARINLFLNQASPIILTITMSLVIFHSYLLIQQTNGGSDLVSADIPKSLMLLQGQNPYSVQPWASPYPPLLLITISGIIRLTSLPASQPSLDLISQHIRTTGLIANSAVALTIYLYIRSKTGKSLQALIPASLFLTLPATSISPLYYFHSDTFGYPLLALSLVALSQHRYLTGTTLLTTATIFKVHPILAIPLVMIWLAKKQGFSRTLPSLLVSTLILIAGLALPLKVPGYQAAMLGFNLSNGFGTGTTSFSVMNLFYGVLPNALSIDVPHLLVNQVWVATTAALFTVVLGIVWTRARTLNPVNIVLLGLLVWLIPLRQLYTHYAVWAIIPFLMRGRLRQTIIVAALLEVADTMAVWSWNPGMTPIPSMSSAYGFFATSLAFTILSITCLRMCLKESASPHYAGFEATNR